MSLFQTLPEVVAFNAKQRANETAFSFENRTTSFAEFDIHTTQIANGLINEGIQPQNRIALLAKDSDLAYELFLGAVKAKAVLVGINWRFTASELEYILQESEAQIVFVGIEFLPVLEKIQSNLSLLKKVMIIGGNNDFIEWRNVQSNAAINLAYNAKDVVVQMYTSGTTGRPKGVQLAHYTFLRMLQGAKSMGDLWMNLNEKDSLLVCVPIFHIGGLWWGVQGFIAGAKNVLLDAFVAWKVLETIEKERITKVAMVPAMIQFCLAEPTCKSTDFSSLQYILYGGSPIAPSLFKEAIETFKVDFFQIYGMTETGNCAVTLRPNEHDITGKERKNAAGKPFPGVEIKIIDNEGNALHPFKTGEICIKSPSVMIGYWKNETATNETLNEGWIKTGDGGYIDNDGFVYVCDRIKDMIICAGENIFPAEIEAALAEHHAVAEVAVIGVPDELWGESVKAFVVLRPEQTIKSRELINFVRTKLADFKAPR